MERKVLEIGEYKIFNNCRVTIIEGGRAIKVFQKIKKPLEKGDYRCKDCKFYADGHSTSVQNNTKVCLKKPKIKKYPGFYYATQKYNSSCENFEKNEKE